MRRVLISVFCLALAAVPAFAIEAHGTNSYLIKVNDASNLAGSVAAAGGTLQRVHPEIGYATATSTDPNFARNLRGAGFQGVDQDLKINWLPSQAIEMQAAPEPAAVTAANPAGAFFYDHVIRRGLMPVGKETADEEAA